MSPYDLDRLAREQREADRRYNDALTELDRIVVGGGAHALTREDFDRFTTALIVYLQQITAFVETKDRELLATAGVRVERIEQVIESIAELRTQIGVLQRAVQKLTRESHQPSVISHQPSAISDQPSALSHQPSRGHDADVTYLAFEDRFRGSDEAIEARLRAYVPVFAGTGDVLDIGCGRGELLAALKAAGISARGVDANGEMTAAARERGVDAVQGDALAYLEGLGDESLGGLVATQVVEHLEPTYLIRLLDTASHKLRAGAPIVLETINAACWLAFFSGYIRDLTHVRPVHPETLQFLLRASGFGQVELRYTAPVPEHMKMKTVDLPAAVLSTPDPAAAALAGVAHVVNANAVILNSLMFTHLDYAAIGYRTG